MPVSGGAQVRASFRKTFANISDKKAPQFVEAVNSIGVNHAKELTPVAYSLLINSIVTDIKVTKTGVIGTVAYMADYAVYLNGTETYTPLWKPVKAPKYGVKGGGKYKGKIVKSRAPAPADNMNAKPRFLNRGFEDAESVSLIKEAEKIFKV